MLHGLATQGIFGEALDQRPLLLASLPQLQTRLACGVVVTMLVLFVVTLRYVNVQLPRVDAFIPIHAITTLITAGDGAVPVGKQRKLPALVSKA